MATVKKKEFYGFALVALLLVVATYRWSGGSARPTQEVGMINERETACPPTKCDCEKSSAVFEYKDTGLPKPIPPFRKREDIGKILEAEGMKIGVEIGVLRGMYARSILSSWKSCKEYNLVDLWKHQKNYKDVNNWNDQTFSSILNECKKRLEKWSEITKFHLKYSTEAAKDFPDEYFDFIYVDARHDRKGVLQDLHAFWPKLKKDGIMAGHDYMTQAEVHSITPDQDWTKNYDGTVDTSGRVTKGAVDDFANSVQRQLVISYRERGWNTWAMRK